MGLVARQSAILLGGAAMAFALGVTGVSAQQAGESPAAAAKQNRVTLLQRIVVGAGAEKVAIDTPQAVTVVEQDDIDRTQANTVSEVLRGVPGVNSAGSDRMFGQSFNIRGIGGSENAGEEGRIIVNVDGASKFYEQYRMGGLFTDPELFKRVEILRGPASSTLYGSGALGGVVNFTTKDASDFIADGDKGALRLKSSYNSNGDGALGSFVWAHRLNQDYDFLLAGNYRRSDPSTTGDGSILKSSDFDTWSGLAKLTGKVGDEGTFRASYQHWDSDAKYQDYAQIGGPLSSFLPGGTPSLTGFGTVDRHVVDKTFVLSYENPVSDNDMLDFRIQGSYSDTSVKQRNATGIPAVGFVCPSSGTATPVMFCDTDFSYQTFQLKAENTSTWRGDNWENHLTYGYQMSHQTRNAQGWYNTGIPFGFGFHPEGIDMKNGVFVQNEFVWNDQLTVIPGMRIDYRTLTPGASTPLTDSTSDWAYSPKIAAHYKINDAFAVFGSYAHTERFPTLDETFQWDFAASYGLRKERSDNFELGFAVSAFDLVQPGDGLQVKVTGFHNDVKDLIVSCRSGGVCGPTGSYTEHYKNLDSARIYGAEVEMAYDSDYVFANASYSHVIGKNTRTDQYLPTVAPHEFGLTLGGKLPDYDLSFGWQARFVSAPQNSALNTGTAPANGSTRYSRPFDVHNVFITWKPQEGQMRGWEVAGGIDNIFNAQYKEFLHNEPSKGRTFKISLSKQFGY
ncbi:TonB-dependent receptor domain-containing protein [Aerobium aerolatum]|uniref:Hemoglobin/transferrin/lactoferrin receptor protein n=1 Tax=Aquamicrobium aerolatum DSM 21857 TaxID=1121003 RepID=A0A1I3KHL1_9HYPH|nr:TonB-dependent receptor [Aquamicrobium aerolatum]SFI71904.1 hemoglobin/transferrin/lactoferrin receptor protein [Aquamicrobium aerolatum DSM 21857]